MDTAEFRKSPSGRLVKSGRGDAAYWYFVPHPLPPELEFTPDLVRALDEAARALGELAGLGRMLPNPQMLVRPFVRREAVASSRIEGTESDLTDLLRYEVREGRLLRLRPGRSVPPSDAREVLNYVHALDYGLARLAELRVSLRLVRELHERLMHGVRGAQRAPGEFRRTQNWIGPPGSTIATASYIPPSVPDMHEALHAFEKHLHEDDPYPALVRLAFVHYQFEAIHPFVDGNGRIGRLLVSLLLVHWGLLPLPLLYLSAFFEEHRAEYYELLHGVSARGAWADWARFFLRGVAEQCRDALQRAKSLQDLQAGWRDRLTRRRASSLALRLADSLFVSPVLTIGDARRVLSVHGSSAQRSVQKLVSEGILTPMGDSKYNRLFEASEILQVVETEHP